MTSAEGGGGLGKKWKYLIEQILLTLVLTEAIIWEEIREAECAYYDELEGASCLDGFHAIDIMVKVFVTHSIKSSNHPMGTLIGIMNNSDLRKYTYLLCHPVRGTSCLVGRRCSRAVR